MEYGFNYRVGSGWVIAYCGALIRRISGDAPILTRRDRFAGGVRPTGGGGLPSQFMKDLCRAVPGGGQEVLERAVRGSLDTVGHSPWPSAKRA